MVMKTISSLTLVALLGCGHGLPLLPQEKPGFTLLETASIAIPSYDLRSARFERREKALYFGNVVAKISEDMSKVYVWQNIPQPPDTVTEIYDLDHDRVVDLVVIREGTQPGRVKVTRILNTSGPRSVIFRPYYEENQRVNESGDKFMEREGYVSDYVGIRPFQDLFDRLVEEIVWER